MSVHDLTKHLINSCALNRFIQASDAHVQLAIKLSGAVNRDDLELAVAEYELAWTAIETACKMPLENSE